MCYTVLYDFGEWMPIYTKNRMKVSLHNIAEGMVENNMEIKKLDDTFSICKVSDYSQIDLDSEFCFIGKTDEEKSLVCITDSVPDNVIERDDGWRAFRIQGVLDFSLIGILSKIAALMAENGIGIFAVSTYNTDYILTKEDNFNKAIEILSAAGYTVVS